MPSNYACQISEIRVRAGCTIGENDGTKKGGRSVQAAKLLGACVMGYTFPDQTDWVPRNGAVGPVIDFLTSILPANDVARVVAIVVGAFILFVQAPAAILNGMAAIARELRPQSSLPASTMPEVLRQA